VVERKTALKWVLRKARDGIQYVEHAEGHGDKLFAAVCNLGLEGIVSKRVSCITKITIFTARSVAASPLRPGSPPSARAAKIWRALCREHVAWRRRNVLEIVGK